jgi:hypothetical protein
MLSNLAMAAALIAAMVVLAALPGPDRAESAFATQKQKGEDENKMPLAVYSAQLPTEPGERAIRVARSGRFDKRYPVPFDELSPTAKGRAVISDWYAYMSALPAPDSDAVVLGEVTEAKGHLSSDRTGAYSEFSVRINDVFKDNGALSRTSLTAVREGADVQLPSGRVIRYEIVHQGTPHIGRRYVFFLKYNQQGQDYTILTGYELRDHRVSPLDEVEPFIAYEKFDEVDFLNRVREAIAR